MTNYVTLLSKHRSAIMGFAIIWIMIAHLKVSFDFIPLQAIKKIGYGGVDIFLFLSGFGLYFSCSKDNFKKRQYYITRFKRILPEFWFVLVFVFIIRMDFTCESFYKLICQASTLGLWVWGKIPYTLWYISCILFFYVIYPQYYSLFKKYGIIVPLLCVGGGILLMGSYALFCFFFFDKQNVGGNAIFAYARIPIFFIGSIFGWMAKNDVKIALTHTHKVVALATVLLLFIALIGIIRLYPSSFVLRVCSLNFIPFIIITPIFCMILAKGFERVDIMDKFFAHIGCLTLELYLCHSYIYILYDYFFVNYGKYIAIIFVVLLSYIAAWVLHILNKECLQRII